MKTMKVEVGNGGENHQVKASDRGITVKLFFYIMFELLLVVVKARQGNNIYFMQESGKLIRNSTQGQKVYQVYSQPKRESNRALTCLNCTDIRA